MIIHEKINPMVIEKEAVRLAAIHGTTIDHELQRQAREHGETDWSSFMATYPNHLQAAMTLRDQWMRPPRKEDGDVGEWDLVPAYNPLTDGHLPKEDDERADYLLAIATLLNWTSRIGKPRNNLSEYAHHVAAAFISWEIIDAANEERRPTLSNGETYLQALQDIIRSRRGLVAKGILPIANALKELGEQRVQSDPDGARLLIDLADREHRDISYVLIEVQDTFIRFHNPALAALVA